jgi:hypothetical protein
MKQTQANHSLLYTRRPNMIDFANIENRMQITAANPHNK